MLISIGAFGIGLPYSSVSVPLISSVSFALIGLVVSTVRFESTFSTSMIVMFSVALPTADWLVALLAR